MNTEIAFPAPKKIKPIPQTGLLAAGNLGPLYKAAPVGGLENPALIEGLVKLITWPDFFLAGPVLGAPMAVMILENLIRRGAKEIVFLGLAGSLSPELKIGDVLCPYGGFSTEGTSAHYPAQLAPDAGLHKRIIEIGRQSGPMASGQVWSTDGIYRETVEQVEKHQAQGAVAVDMETTALWAAANFRGLKLASILVISDYLEGREHHPGFHLPQFRQGLARATKLAWQATLK